jgi:electron-transferring-flavoprotein dehydrogenase
MEREVLETDVLIVGAGPAGLACAIRLAELTGNPDAITVIEKGRDVGAHLLSGAVMDPRGIRELFPSGEIPLLDTPVRREGVFFLGRSGRWKLPVEPPPLRNRGNYVISLHRLARWMNQRLEALGVQVFTSTAAVEYLSDGGRVAGVRTDDKGRDRQGRPKANFQPGADIRAKVTVLAEGVRGSVAKQLIARHSLDGQQNAPAYAVGIKELWELPPGRLEPGTVYHTLGHPLGWRQFGGGWIYGMRDNIVSIGLVCGLDYRDPRFDPHNAFQQYKLHPFVRRLLDGGRLIKYGAKALPEGGWWALPRLYTAGALLIGDAAGFLNSLRLKGIHLAIKSGLLAAETIHAALPAGDFSAARLADFSARVESSWIREELWPARNAHQAFEHGLWPALLHLGAQMLTGGRGLRARYPFPEGITLLDRLDRLGPPPPRIVPDGRLTFDKVTDVYYSSTSHEEDQPAHLLIADTNICSVRCTLEYGNPCQNFCPAAVYEIEQTPRGNRVRLNASNCVHCKTCDIMDPYGIITWVPPEGGGGPNYEGM